MELNQSLENSEALELLEPSEPLDNLLSSHYTPPDSPPPILIMAQNQALTDAANAMNALAAALGQGSEKTLVQVSSFLGDGSQDPEEWLDEFRRAGIANKWSTARGLELVPVYLKGVALDWYQSLNPAPNALMMAMMLHGASSISFELASTLPNRKPFGKNNFSRLSKDQTP